MSGGFDSLLAYWLGGASATPPIVPPIVLYEVDCIEPGKGQPVLKFSRVDPAQLPREFELQFVDATQNYAMVTQSARHQQGRIKDGIPEKHAAVTATSKSSTAIDFLITAQEGRTMAFDLLYRAWTEAVSLQFIHPNLALESGDAFEMIGRFGSLIGRIDEQVWTKQRTSQISATLLAPVGPAMGADDTLGLPPNSVEIRANIGIGIWGGFGAWGTVTPADASATCCAAPEAQGTLTTGISTHIRLKKKASTAPAVEFLAGAG